MPIPTFPELAAQVVTMLTLTTPYLKNMAEGAGKELGASALRKAGEMLGALRARWRKDGNDKAVQTLDLFEGDPEMYEGPLSKLLVQSLTQHPEWAQEIAALLGGNDVQEIIARNQSVVDRITMTATGSGTQRIDADNSKVSIVKMTRK